tara:strand:- start:785 stop:1183 length:399 start_codon:yes stop_codon:yes gene_type:complete
MAKVSINGQNFITAALCGDGCCCVAVRKEGLNFLIADTKDPSAEPLVINATRWESLKSEIQGGKLNLTELSEQASDLAEHGISVRKIHSHLLVCDTVTNADYSLAFTLKEWDAFIEGIKADNFEDILLANAA